MKIEFEERGKSEVETLPIQQFPPSEQKFLIVSKQETNAIQTHGSNGIQTNIEEDLNLNWNLRPVDIPVEKSDKVTYLFFQLFV